MYSERERRRKLRASTFEAAGVISALLVLALLVFLLTYPGTAASVRSLLQQSWLQIALSVPFFTFVFDLVDLRPTIGSFSFVTTKTYAVYLVFRAILAFLAAAILSQSHLVSNPFLLSLASVVTSVTVLQNFALNVAGKEAANLSDLFDTFKDMMETEEKKRVAEEKNAKLAAMADELSALNLDYLKWEARVLSQISASGTDPVTEAEQLKGTDQQQVYLANYLVTQNPEFSRRVIEEAVRYKATQTKTAP